MTVAADGEVLDGNATVDTSSITGESVPVDVGAGSIVYSGSIVMEGGFHLRATRVGADTTIGRVIQLVEQAEANKGRVQRFADRFSGYYLPIVLGIAAITYVLRQDVMAAVSVLVVVCSCAIALATPIAMLASIGAAGKQGLVIGGTIGEGNY
jgi:P-type E1-E2 ATPase